MLAELYAGELDAMFISTDYPSMFSGIEAYKNIKEDTKIIYTKEKKMKKADTAKIETASAGKTVTVNLFVKNNPGFNAASIKIDYDTTRLKLIGAELSEEFGNGTTVSYDNLPYLTFVRGDNINSMSASSIRRAVLKYLLLNSFIRRPPRIIPPIRLSPLQAVLSQTRISFCPRQAVSCRSDN